MAALCSGDKAAFRDHLTAPSRALLDGLNGLAPEAFSCEGQEQFQFAPAGIVKEGLFLVTMTFDGRPVDLVLVQEDGRWLLDLFLTEQSAFYAGRLPEESAL